MLVLNIFKFIAYRRQALSMIGQLSRKYASFVKQDMAMFEILEKEKRENHVSSDQECAEFLQECGNSANKDFNIELYIRARYLVRLLTQCTQARIKDLYVIFDNPSATQQAARFLDSNRLKDNCVLERLRKLEFTHSPSQPNPEFFIVGQLLSQTTRNLNRVRIYDFRVMASINEVGLNSFIKLKKLRLEHLEAEAAHEETYSLFLTHLRANTTLTFVKLERVFTRDNSKLLMLRDALKTSKVKKMVLWLSRGTLEATDQICQFLVCKRL